MWCSYATSVSHRRWNWFRVLSPIYPTLLPCNGHRRICYVVARVAGWWAGREGVWSLCRRQISFWSRALWRRRWCPWLGCVTRIDVLLLLLLFVLELLHHHIERGYSRIIIVAGGVPPLMIWFVALWHCSIHCTLLIILCKYCHCASSAYSTVNYYRWDMVLWWTTWYCNPASSRRALRS